MHLTGIFRSRITILTICVALLIFDTPRSNLAHTLPRNLRKQSGETLESEGLLQPDAQSFQTSKRSVSLMPARRNRTNIAVWSDAVPPS